MDADPLIGHTVTVNYVDGKKQELTILPMPVARYQKAMRCFRGDGYDELGLLDLAFNQQPEWSVRLTPDSYAEAVAVMEAANPVFFASAARQAAWKAGIESVSRNMSQTSRSK